MKKLFLAFISLLFTIATFAQNGFGTFKELRVRDNTLFIVTDQGVLLFRQYPNNVLQTTFEPNGRAGEQVSNAVLQKPVKAPRITRNDAMAIQFMVGTTLVSVQKNPLQVQYGNAKQGFALTGYSADAEQQVLKFAVKTDEQFFGTGSRSIPFNRRGYKVELNNNPWYGYNINADNLNYSMPFIQSDHGYAIFLDNPSKGYLDIGKTKADVLEAGLKGGKLQFYTFFGNTPAKILQQFTALVGRMSLPPRWAMGNFMSRFGYRTQDEVMSISKMMKDQHFPFDAVIIDLFWFGDGVHGAWKMGNLDWNKQRFPNPEQMIADLKKEDIKTILIAEPFVLSESFNYKYTQENKLNAVDKNGDTICIKEFFFGYAGLLDIFQSKTKDWFWSKYNAQVQKGVAGWWGDLGEPEKHPNYLYHNLKDMGQKRLFNADEVHNLYGHTWSQMLFEKYAKNYPDQRLFHLNRSGYAGTWRYGSYPWSGDIERSWNGFNAQLPIMLGMGMSGVPTMHSDAGGFAMGKRDPELYRRWLQMAVFSPIFRPHGSVNAPDPKIPQIESEPVFYDEPDKSILRSFVELRYRLMPYIYNLAYEAATTGAPFVRPMFFNDASDPELYKATDQYMFGSALLVAPVLEQGATKRKLYLPKGEWYDFWNPEKRIKGAQWLEVDVNAATIPVFVKAGSVIPMKPVFENTAQYPKGRIVLHYYAAEGNSQSVFYEDDGVSPDAIKANKYELITVKTNTKGQQVTMTIVGNGGQYKGKPAKRQIELFVHGVAQPKQVLVNGSVLSKWLMENGAVSIPSIIWETGVKKVVLQ